MGGNGYTDRKTNRIKEAIMNADAFRNLYQYHFTINRKIWTQCVIPLTDEQFLRDAGYSIGSVRNQVVHMMNIDDRWFSGLRGLEVPPFLDPKLFTSRDQIRKQWDDVEEKMLAYLENLHDDDLFTHPLGEDEPLFCWQILIHVSHHGMDHRAQLLALLNQLGAQTFPQDYFFFVIGKL
jgi:uncharacterized damage-inducible protein DinB